MVELVDLALLTLLLLLEEELFPLLDEDEEEEEEEEDLELLLHDFELFEELEEVDVQLAVVPEIIAITRRSCRSFILTQ